MYEVSQTDEDSIFADGKTLHCTSFYAEKEHLLKNTFFLLHRPA